MKLFCAEPFIRWTTREAFVLLCLLSSGSNATASENIEKQLLDVFPPSVATVDDGNQSRTSISLDYTPSKSLWAEGLNERNVFHAQIQDQAESNSFAMERVVDEGLLASVPPSCTGKGPSRHHGTTRSGSLSPYVASTTE